MLGKAGAWSANEKRGRSADRQWKNRLERGALETPGGAPTSEFFQKMLCVVKNLYSEEGENDSLIFSSARM